MYESFFNLRSKPFDLLPDPRFFYLSKSHKKALTYIDYGIRERSGFVLLTGEVGSGKTTLIRDLLENCYENLVVSKIFNTLVTSDQLLAMINDDFGLTVQGKDKVTLIRDLNEFLIDQYSRGNQPVLIIDEAQNLSPELLEEVRMLSNLEASTSKLLQIILVGQPELRTHLATPKLRQLRQRININCHLQALSRPELEQYIIHRLDVAGNAEAVHFTPDSLDEVFRYSRGIPRLINILCDFLMLSAFAEETTSITIEMIHEVIGDLDFENYYWMSDAEEQSPEQGTIHLPAAEKTAPPPKPLDMPRHIDADGYGASAPLQSPPEDQDVLVAQDHETVMPHVDEPNSHFHEMSRRLEDLSSLAKNSDSGTAHNRLNIGIVRRVLGVTSALARK